MGPVVRRWQAVALIVLVIGLVPLTAADVPPSYPQPAVTLASGMPDDLQHLVRQTWRRFVQAFPARAGCLEPLTVDGAWELADRARYDPARHVVQVRIPATAPNLEASLVHEFAHHLEFTCRRQIELRASFLLAQGFDRQVPWFDGGRWEQTPSEQFAEAVGEYVLGERPAHARTTTTGAALRVIETWATAD